MAHLGCDRNQSKCCAGEKSLLSPPGPDGNEILVVGVLSFEYGDHLPKYMRGVLTFAREVHKLRSVGHLLGQRFRFEDRRLVFPFAN